MGETRTHFQFYHVATEPTCPIWTVDSVIESEFESHQVRRFSYGSGRSADNATSLTHTFNITWVNSNMIIGTEIYFLGTNQQFLLIF